MKADNYLINAQRQLSEKDLIIYNAELQKSRKSVLVAYILLLCTPFGFHKFYIGKIGSGIAYLILGVLFYIFGMVIIFGDGNYENGRPSDFVLFLICAFAISFFYELLTLSSQVNELEASNSKKLLAQFGIIKEEPKKTKEDLVENEINLECYAPVERTIDDIKLKVNQSGIYTDEFSLGKFFSKKS
jgi:TM2 domain-containing membrane protein YozV